MGFLNKIKGSKETEIKKEKIEPDKEKEWPKSKGKLTIDFYETPEELVIEAPIAGVEIEDLDISVENDMLIIKGERNNLVEEKKDYISQECFWGKFIRKVIFPQEIDKEKIEAKMIDGILVIRMPKIEKRNEKKIKVEREE